MADVKKILKETIEKAKQAKAEEDLARQKKNDEDRTKILEGVGSDLAKSLEPALQALANNAQMNEEQIRNALSEAITMNMPEIDTESISNAIREAITQSISQVKINVPPVKVNVPETKFPDIKIPETKFPTSMSVGLENYTNKNPIPVRIFDAQGKDFQFSFPSIGGGGKSDFFTVKGITNTVGVVTINPDGSPVYSAGSALGTVSISDIFGTVGADVVNPDGRIKVELPTGSSSLTDTELRASSVPVAQASGAVWSTSVVAITDIFSTTSTSNVVNPDNRVKVELPTGSSGLTDTELRASSVPVAQASDAIWSTNVLTMPAVVVTSITNTIAANIVDSSGIAYSTTNPLPIDDAGGSITIDGTVAVSGVTGTIVAVGPVVSDAASNGDAPLKMGGIARTANPTAVANSDMVSATFDDLGRQLVRPVQIRDLIRTAYATLSTNTETTLFAGVTSTFHDIIYIKFSNTSTGAVTVDLRGTVAGNIVDTFEVPANGTVGIATPVPIPAADSGATWTVDYNDADLSNTTVYVSALLTAEV